MGFQQYCSTTVRNPQQTNPIVNYGQMRQTTQTKRWWDQLPVERKSLRKDKVCRRVHGGWILYALTSCSATSSFHGWQSECQCRVRNFAHNVWFMALSCCQPPAGLLMGFRGNQTHREMERRRHISCVWEVQDESRKKVGEMAGNGSISYTIINVLI